MRKLRIVISTLAMVAAANAAAEPKPAATPRPAAVPPGTTTAKRIPFKELPPAVQSQVGEIQIECRVPAQFMSATSARALEINGDFRTDFLYSPGEGNRSWPDGFGGLCGAADGSRQVLLTSNDAGGYDQIVLGSYVAVLKSADDVIFTDWCGGSHADPSISLAVFDNERKKLVQFGRCYSSLSAAIASAERKGYQLVRW